MEGEPATDLAKEAQVRFEARHLFRQWLARERI